MNARLTFHDWAPPGFLKRFNDSVKRDASGCRLWTGAIMHKGYGVIRFRHKHYRAHRVAFELFRGAIPAGLFVLHRCDVRNCVNPDHLFLGTAKDNAIDSVLKKRWARQVLTADDVRVIVVKLRTTPIAAVARKYGVDRKTIAMIASNQSWKHIPRKSPNTFSQEGEHPHA